MRQGKGREDGVFYNNNEKPRCVAHQAVRKLRDGHARICEGDEERELQMWIEREGEKLTVEGQFRLLTKT